MMEIGSIFAGFTMGQCYTCPGLRQAIDVSFDMRLTAIMRKG